MNHCAVAGACFLSTDLAELRALLAGFDPLIEALPADATALEREYVRLFLRPRAAVVAPWQSCQQEPPQLMGPPHDSALAWYRRYGWQTRNANEPADHIGLLLQFYAYLVSLGAGAEELQAFRDQHLTWIPAACQRIRTATHEPFYRCLADFTLAQLAA